MHPNAIDAQRCFVLVVDLQQSYADKLFNWDRAIERACILIKAAHEVGVPVVYTEQYPKGLGHTTPRVLDALDDAPRFEKRTLSCLGAPDLADYVRTLEAEHVVVCGIETHACINHTVHDLLDAGYRVHLPEDALGSRKREDHEVALQKMLGSGALPSSVEMAALEWLRTSDHPKFKAVQALLK